MLSFNRRTKIFIFKEPTDMRESFDGLFNKAKTVLRKDPFSGHLFTFINKRRCSCKCLYYDGTGLVIIVKRLEEGLFSRINPRYKREIVLSSLNMAYKNRSGFLNGIIFHSDKGSQYSSKDVRKYLKLNGFHQSMSEDCYENSITETFFATLKKELVY